MIFLRVVVGEFICHYSFHSVVDVVIKDGMEQVVVIFFSDWIEEDCLLDVILITHSVWHRVAAELSFSRLEYVEELEAESHR